MLLRLILLFTLLPALELVLILQMGRHLGVWPTVAIILGTGVLGGLLARTQGLRVLRRIQADLAARRAPSEGLVDGLLILLAGALLITPGFVTDLVGLALLLPWSRRALKWRLRRRLEKALERGSVRLFWMGP